MPGVPANTATRGDGQPTPAGPRVGRWWPTEADLAAMVGLVVPDPGRNAPGPASAPEPASSPEPARPTAGQDADCPTVLAAQLSLLFR